MTFRWYKVPENPPFQPESSKKFKGNSLGSEPLEFDDEVPPGGIMLGDVYSDSEFDEESDDGISIYSVDESEGDLPDEDFVPAPMYPVAKILPSPYEAFPYQRYGHTVVTYRGKAYLWGGRNDDAGASEILHEYDPGEGFIFGVKFFGTEG